MDAPDISDLPTPSSTPADISDLPTPGAASTATHWDPTEGMSNTDKFLAGTGKAFSDTGSGVHQIALHIGHHLGLVSDEDLQKNQDEIDSSKELDKPLMRTKAGISGNIVGQAAPMLLAPEVGLLGSAAEGAIVGATQPVSTGESRGQNAGIGAIGGGAGAAVGKVASGVLRGFGGTGGRKAAVDILTSEGIPTSVAQKTGAKAAQTVERASGMTSDAPAEFAAHQGTAFNRAVLKRIGVTDATAATPDVLGPARSRITGVMDDVASRNNVKVDSKLLNDMVDVEQSAMRQLPKSDIGPINQNLSDILENASINGGSLDGTFHQKLNSNLGALSRNPATAPIVNDLQEAMHDALQRSATPEDVIALKNARQQYRALKQIEPAVDPSTGNISVPKLMTSLNSKTYGSRNQTLYGKGDQSLVNLARAAKHVIPDNLGNSGSAERALPVLGAMETLSAGEPVKAGIKLAAGTLGLNTAGKAMRNQGVVGKYLANGIPWARGAGPAVKRVAPAIGYGTAEAEPREGDIERASGGRVDHEVLVQRLMNRWKYAKRVTNQMTKPLLGIHDNVIAKALDIAQRTI